MINEDVRHIVEAELREGETLLWADKPSKKPISFMAIYITGFSIVWTTMAIGFVGAGAFASLFSVATVEDKATAAGTAAFGAVFSIVSLLFVAIGVGMILWGLKMLIGPSKEIYALTNQRGIVLSPFIKYRITSLSYEILKNSERKGDHQLGTLTFTNQTELNAFLKIKNPKQVEDLIHKTFEETP